MPPSDCRSCQWTSGSHSCARGFRSCARYGGRTKAAAGLPETTSYPRPVGSLPLIVGGRSARVLRVAAELGDGCNVPATIEHVTRAAALMNGKRVTVLDVPVVGRDRDEVATVVERLRGRVSAAAYARTHHAGVIADHVTRYRELSDLGVDTVFVALPDLHSADDVEKFGDVISALGERLPATSHLREWSVTRRVVTYKRPLAP